MSTNINMIAANNSLRIAMLSIHSSPTGLLGTQDTGGMSVYVREAAKWIASEGNLVDIFTYTPGNSATIDLYPNVRLIHLGADSRKEITKEALFHHLPDVVLALQRHVQKGQRKYHIIHSHYWLSGLVGTMVQQQWGCPHLTMFHTLGLIKNSTTIGESEPDRRIVSERKLVDTAQGIVVPTVEEKKNLLKHYGAAPGKVYVIPCGVNVNRFKPIDRKRARMQLALDPESPVALFVGRFAPVKGLAHLLEAIAELVPRFPRLRLLIVGGDGPEADTSLVLLQQAEKLGVLAHLTMVGRIDHDDLPLYYSAADLLVLPSSYESFGLVTLEALACGTPVAATATGGAASIIREGVNGTFFDRLDGTSISQGIERVLIQARQRKYSVDRLRTAATALSWDRISALILKTYHSLLS